MTGVFEGKIVDYGVSLTSSDKPQVFITGEFMADGETKKMTWYGQLTGKGTDITMRTLLYCGLAPNDAGKLNTLEKGPVSGLLDTEKQMSFDVQQETYYTKEGTPKEKTFIKWINDPQLAPTVRRIDESANNAFFGENDNKFTADIQRLAQSLGVPMDGLQKAPAATKKPVEEERKLPTDTSAVEPDTLGKLSDEDMPF